MILSGFANPGIFDCRHARCEQNLEDPFQKFAFKMPIKLLNAYLLVDGWIPVAVVEDDRVRSGQVDAQAPGSGRQQENKDVL
jgi:hypothetical protein